MSLSEHMIRLFTTLFVIFRRFPEWMEKMRPHMTRLQLAWKDLKQIIILFNRRGNTPRPPTPGPVELKDVVVTQTAEGIHLGCGTMEEMLIILRAEAPELVQKHSMLLMEDGCLSHAARLAARQERLLTDPTLPDNVAVERVKPVDRQLRRAVKKLRQLQTQPLTPEEEAQEEQELLTPALSKWMRRTVRAVQPDRAAPIVTRQRHPGWTSTSSSTRYPIRYP